jgi:hypothetical protein
MKRILTKVVWGLLLGMGVVATAQAAEISSSPTSLSFGNVYIGKASGSKVLTITNVSTGTVIINSVGFDCAGYGLASGVAPTSLFKPGDITHYSVFLQPTLAQSYNCNFVITLSDNSTLDVPLTGTGVQSNAVSSLSTTSVNFGSVTQGGTSAAQSVTITNTGTAKLTLSAISVVPVNYVVAPVTLPYSITAGSSLTLSLTYSPTNVTTDNGVLDLTYNEVRDNAVSLTGTGTTPSSISVTTLALLPQATTNSAWQVQLQSAGGKAPVNWGLSTGSVLPKGLKGNKSGLITGTLDSSITAGTYTFSLFAKDVKGVTATKTFTLNVYAPPGISNCNNISFNVPNTTTPIVALTDLGTGTYQGYEGGLYPNGSNVRPQPHDSDGVTFADGIQPLDSNGNPSPTGKYVLLAIGESTAQNEFNRFLPIANADPQKNANLVIVNGAQGGATPNMWTISSSYYWDPVINNYLPQNGVTAKQVVAIWMEDTDGIAMGSFPTDMTTLQSEYETMMNDFLTNFPNVKLVYMSARTYAGYSNGTTNPSNPEPYAFEMGYAVKNAIADQINGASNLNYNPNNGPVVAPWMSWGPYYWANGLLGRQDGLYWDCQDFSSDGTHPSSTWGQLKVANQLLQFLKSDDTTTPWYIQH